VVAEVVAAVAAVARWQMEVVQAVPRVRALARVAPRLALAALGEAKRERVARGCPPQAGVERAGRCLPARTPKDRRA